MELNQDLNNIISHLVTFESRHGFNPFDNYSYRELIVTDIASSVLNEHIEYQTDRSGPDALIGKLQVEIKTGKSKRLKSGKPSISVRFEYDKCDEPERQQSILNYDYHVFAPFFEHRPLAVIIFTKDSIRELLEYKFSNFDKFVRKCADNNKRLNRDSIKIRLSELYTLSASEDYLFYSDHFNTFDEMMKR